MSRQQEQLLTQWDKQYPPNQWELERDKRIAARMGHSNPFVIGTIKWNLGHKNSGVGLAGVAAQQPTTRPTVTPAQKAAPQPTPNPDKASSAVRGNRNSMIYHLSRRCPSYDKIAPHNRVPFTSAAAAEAASYRMARNCK